MLHNRFVLKNELSKITIKGGYLNQFPDLDTEKSIHISPSGIDILIKEDSSLESFENELKDLIRKKSRTSYLKIQLKNKLGFILTLVVSMLIIILIALLSVHGSLSYDLFSGNESENIFKFRDIYLYFLLTIFILLFLVFSPRIILGDYDNLFEWANKRFSSDSRILKRLTHEVKLLSGLSSDQNTIRLWNPLVAGMDAMCCHHLIPALTMVDTSIEYMVRTDDRENMFEVLTDSGSHGEFIAIPDAAKADNRSVFPFQLLTRWEKDYFNYLLFSSSLNLPQSWNEDHVEGVIISRELSERIYNLLESKLSSSGPGDTSFEKFMNRCIHDYAYLESRADQGMQYLILSDPSLADFQDSSLTEIISDTVKNKLANISENMTDPQALVILIGLAGNGKELESRVIRLVQDFIQNVKRSEKYWLISNYWHHISADKGSSQGEFKLGLLQFMDVPALRDLSVCFVNAGMYADAFEVYEILENIYPARIAIEIADLKDSLGEYKEALQILLKTDADWVQSGIIEDRALILELYLNISWVIVSGRFDEHRAHGYDYLGKTDIILKKLPNTEDYLQFLTRYYNTIANYHEWEQKYDMAIENYEKALKLPGTILRKSSLLSNRGIAERLLGKAARDVSTARKHFLSSRSNIQQAVKMKISIGEKNQIPGSSHNLAETLLELSRVTDDNKEKISILKEVDRVTLNALMVLNELNSSKRKGRLLTERYIAHHLLAEVDEPSDKRSIEPVLKDWLGSEDKNSYDYQETTHLLKRFNVEV